MTKQEAYQLYEDFWNECMAWPIPPRFIEQIGSSTYRDDPNDMDVIVLVYDLGAYLEQATAKMFTFSPNHAEYPGEWESLRRGGINLLVTEEEDYYNLSVTASNVCKALRLPARKERVIIHRIIVDKMSADEAVYVADIDSIPRLWYTE